jgi:hypothetical protein
VFEFLARAQTWYNQKTADILVAFKNATDSYGNKLLDNTIVSYTTEVAQAAHEPRRDIPGMIFGGKALGMQGGQYFFYPTNGNRSHNDLWMTIAQAYFKTTDPLAAIRALETPTFVTQNVSPIPGTWVAPA